MPLFPKIESPCPYKGQLADIMQGDTCRLCKREVFDLTAMDDGGRARFMATCGGDACVTYRLPSRATIVTAAALASMAVPLAAAAQDKPAVAPQAASVTPAIPATIAPLAAEEVETDDYIILTGGTRPSMVGTPVAVTTLSADDLYGNDHEYGPGVIDLIGKLFRKKR